jgi:hypothetical protein
MLVKQELQTLEDMKTLYSAKQFAAVNTSGCDRLLALQIQDSLDADRPLLGE